MITTVKELKEFLKKVSDDDYVATGDGVMRFYEHSITRTAETQPISNLVSKEEAIKQIRECVLDINNEVTYDELADLSGEELTILAKFADSMKKLSTDFLNTMSRKSLTIDEKEEQYEIFQK